MRSWPAVVALLAGGCAPSVATIRKDIYAGRTPGAYVQASRGSAGPSLAAIRVELRGLEPWNIEQLLAQGVPVLARLSPDVLIVGRDRRRALWILEDRRVVSDIWLSERWDPLGRRALAAFPAERRIEGLGVWGHRRAADQAEALRLPGVALWHL